MNGGTSQSARVMQSALEPKPLRDMFTAWRLSTGKAVRIAHNGDDLDLVLAEAQLSCSHKDKLFLLHTDRLSGAKMLHCYTIRQGARIHRIDPETRQLVAIHPLKAELLFAMPVIDFAPDEPWQWSPGCDVVGAVRNEVRA